MSFQSPDEIFTKLRLITLDIAQEVEARVSKHLDITYRDGWVDGYRVGLEDGRKSEENDLD